MAVNATAVWRVRPSGSNTNGGGYDSGISGAATDYSQQNAAQASGTNGSGSATTTFTDATANAFTSAMVGNAINISGQGVYFVTAFISSSQVTVDRTLGTFSGASWSLGGGWADPWTNCKSSASIVVPGNTIFILGSGTPNPSSYTFDYTAPASNQTPTGGSASSGGLVVYANDPSTPGYKAAPDTTGGMPCISYAASGSYPFTNTSYNIFKGLWLVPSSGGSAAINTTGGGQATTVFGCVFDLNGINTAAVDGSSPDAIVGCEVFSALTGTAGSSLAVQTFRMIIGNNIHDTLGPAISLYEYGVISDNIIAKNSGDGIQPSGGSDAGSAFFLIKNNTIDGNGGNGIYFNSEQVATLNASVIMNNIISNHTGVSMAGINISAGSAALNSSLSLNRIDYNVFFNNTSNYTGINAAPHDTALGVTPYVNSGSENYTLA